MRRALSLERYLGHIPMAHRLMNHKGECRYVHGHNYGITIELATLDGQLDLEGMIADFAMFKVIKQHLEVTFDHALILQAGDPVQVLFEGSKGFIGHDKLAKLVLMRVPPTVENMAHELGNRVEEFIAARLPNVYLKRLTLEETPNARAVVDFRP